MINLLTTENGKSEDIPIHLHGSIASHIREFSSVIAP